MMNDNFNNSGILTLGEVSNIIMMDSIPAVKKWLISKNIRINKFSKANYVYEIEVLCEIDKQLALNLKWKNPNQWKEMYKCIAKNSAIYELVLMQIGEEIVHKPLYKVKTRGSKDEKLLNELLSI
ncbi:hypothetical protein [Flavobacterium sp.]|jgi:hypothetical protein|uniref:hypothetical protein n=1 Tax=Flavobacterium sp. TaxID=239 RepID=UPI0037BF305F